MNLLAKKLKSYMESQVLVSLRLVDNTNLYGFLTRIDKQGVSLHISDESEHAVELTSIRSVQALGHVCSVLLMAQKDLHQVKVTLQNYTSLIGQVTDLDETHVCLEVEHGEHVLLVSEILTAELFEVPEASSEVQTVESKTLLVSTQDQSLQLEVAQTTPNPLSHPTSIATAASHVSKRLLGLNWPKSKFSDIDRTCPINVKLHPKASRIWGRALNYYRDRSWQKAADEFKTFCRRFPDYHTGYYDAAVSLNRAGDVREAVAFYSLALDKQETAESLKNGILSCVRSGLWHPALLWMERYLALTGGADTDAFIAIEFQLKFGLLRSAAATIRTAVQLPYPLAASEGMEYLGYLVSRSRHPSPTLLCEIDKCFAATDISPDQIAQIAAVLESDLENLPSPEYLAAQDAEHTWRTFPDGDMSAEDHLVVRDSEEAIPQYSPPTQERTEADDNGAHAAERNNRKHESSPSQISTSHVKQAPSQPQRTGSTEAVRPLRGTYKGRKLYERAAAAHTEKKYDRARSLYYEAIDKGAGPDAYINLYKLQWQYGNLEKARAVAEKGIERFPEFGNLYEIYGQTEKRNGNYELAKDIFERGLKQRPRDSSSRQRLNLLMGLAQTLVLMGSEESFSQAGEIYQELKRLKKLNEDDGIYQRYIQLKNNPLAYKAFNFFKAAGVRVAVLNQSERSSPPNTTDLIVHFQNQQLEDSFGLEGYCIITCVNQESGLETEIERLSRYLQTIDEDRKVKFLSSTVVLNPSISFVVVKDSSRVNDHIRRHHGLSREAIVPLDIRQIEETTSPSNTLLNQLGEYLGQRDLYHTTRGAVSGKFFFGREQLLNRLTDGVQQGAFIGIYGLRKMGKSSLARQLSEDKLKGNAVAFVDLQTLSQQLDSRQDFTALYWEIERSLHRRLSGIGSEAADLLHLARFERFDDIPYDGLKVASMFTDDLHLLLDGISSARIGQIQSLVIILDEVEKILPISGQEIGGYIEFFQLLRGLSQTYPGRVSNIIVAANAIVSEQSYWNGRENPVFAYYNKVLLPPFSETECAQMITELGKGMSVYWETEAVDSVFDETGGHPFLTRSFCSYIVQHHAERPLTIRQSVVEDAVQPFLRDEEYQMRQIIDLVAANFPEDAALLREIALGETPPLMSDESLRHLMDYYVIAETKDRNYKLTINLLYRWFCRQAGVTP